MKNFASPLVAACLASPALAGDVLPPKTNSSIPIDEALLTQRPYSQNGVVLAGALRGSGFVAEHPNLFITAAHVLYSDEGKWASPPIWAGGVNSLSEPQTGTITSRGYFRWAAYSKQAAASGGDSVNAFKQDVALAWAFTPFTAEQPALLDFKGTANLRSGISSMITGYPALIDYTEAPGNYLLHSTLEETTRYKAHGNYLTATHISTGPGNSGGPVWVRDADSGWKVGGVLVSGRPSENGIYGFSSQMKTLLKAADPVLATTLGELKPPSKIGTTSRIAILSKPKTIPDGRQKWTRVPLNVGSFPAGSAISKVKLNLTITTDHIGDLVVQLVGPNGTSATLHDSEGAGGHDLVINDMDLSAAFRGTASAEGIPAKWFLQVQDRLTGDIAVVTRFQLEVGID
ncbi:proprotein convertase P-domain-containing protein [Luteolibacter flavescens]|uniref:Proprotein convertase P-domain-containing protein n=1 Tax=Luteolibacter flavescens TaxID=1859460 RepID=A0ABT3FRH0_9BACT|nr:proprotein convertase P-domain-containing protein [Luteolibacter flavescens]MCW1885831.1 proprotein convertase P-domain-containing protein [Luteolibacter flavescens]